MHICPSAQSKQFSYTQKPYRTRVIGSYLFANYIKDKCVALIVPHLFIPDIDLFYSNIILSQKLAAN